MTHTDWRATAYVAKGSGAPSALHNEWCVYVDTKGKGPIVVAGPFTTKADAELARDAFARRAAAEECQHRTVRDSVCTACGLHYQDW